jgi:SAM-dependent methyltransferase
VQFLRTEELPVSCNHLCTSRAAALSEPRAAVSLNFCPDCGHVFNSEYDSARLKYQPGYESSLGGSLRFRKYDDALVDMLLKRYRLRKCLIVEIGCGRGHFLQKLCETGDNSGIGYDPSYSAEAPARSELTNIVIRPEAYGSCISEQAADFICSRHTLEHVGEPRDFLSNIWRSSRAGVPVFFEVPNGLYTLRDGGIWDIIYEHCSYFTPSSLARLFYETGFDPIGVQEAFAGQFLTIHAMTSTRQRGPTSSARSDLGALISSFVRTYESKLSRWGLKLQKLQSEGRRVVVWGGGAKATTFLNLLKPAAIDYVIDVNPRKQGNYVIGTGQQIVPPEFLREYPVDEIICLNPNYVEEIGSETRALGLQANLSCA